MNISPTKRELEVLEFIGKGERSAKDISEKFVIELDSARVTLHRMTKKGLVNSRKAPIVGPGEFLSNGKLFSCSDYAKNLLIRSGKL